MSTSKQLAKQVHQVYFGGNWTEVNLKTTLSQISYKMATKKLDGFNTILELTFHIHYFLKVQLRVLKEGILEGKDSESYKHPNILNSLEWETMLNTMWLEAEDYVKILSEFPDNNLEDHFTNKKYGTYTSNILGLIEHTHYHLGQIVILKKLIETNS